VAAFVVSLPTPRPPATLTGDVERGRTAYATCLACHGERAAGNEALKAPALSRQADWYLVAQIQKFRAGWRGTHPRDETGAQMRPMAMTLGDERAIRDVVAYIRSLED
jgi:cytochrome c553